MRVIEDTNMVEYGEPYEVIRAWKERLFTRPWQPLKVTKIIVPKVPRKQIWRVNNTLIMHPEMANKLKRQISNIKDLNNG